MKKSELMAKAKATDSLCFVLRVDPSGQVIRVTPNASVNWPGVRGTRRLEFQLGKKRKTSEPGYGR